MNGIPESILNSIKYYNFQRKFILEFSHKLDDEMEKILTPFLEKEDDPEELLVTLQKLQDILTVPGYWQYEVDCRVGFLKRTLAQEKEAK